MLREQWKKDFDKKFGTWKLCNPTKHSIIKFISELLPKNKWVSKFPNKEGLYWFYGYRYGKKDFIENNEKEFMLVDVRKIQNGFLTVANGQFMNESEIEEALFCKTKYPDIPKMEK